MKEGSDTSKTIMAVVAMSLFGYPGAGHFWIKRPGRGVFWGVLFTVLMLAALGTTFYNLYVMYKASTTLADPGDLLRNWLPCLLWMAACALSWVLSAVDAAWLSTQQPPPQAPEP